MGSLVHGCGSHRDSTVNGRGSQEERQSCGHGLTYVNGRGSHVGITVMWPLGRPASHMGVESRGHSSHMSKVAMGVAVTWAGRQRDPTLNGQGNHLGEAFMSTLQSRECDSHVGMTVWGHGFHVGVAIMPTRKSHGRGNHVGGVVTCPQLWAWQSGTRQSHGHSS